MLNSGELYNNISAELADNNAGLISAYDVRHNMEDIVVSINKIVASGDTDVEFPFFNIVKVSKVDAASPTSTTATNGDMILESGLFFPNAPVNATERQTEPWLGESRINHNNLDNLTVGDPHTQYYKLTGDRALEGNMPTDTFWINKSGIQDVGFSFEQLNPTATEQEIYVSGQMRWVEDNSTMRTGKGVAKAWLNFDANRGNGVPTIRSHFGIEKLERLAEGKLKITLSSGIFDNNNYIAIGTANATTAAGSMEDFSVNTVGLVLREGNDGPDDGATKRTITYVIKNENGDYVDSEICDFVCYGYGPAERSGVHPTVVGI